jgi:hypothetical protein
VKTNQGLFNKINEWMLGFREGYKNDKSFEIVDGMYCDGIIIPKLLMLFPTQSELKMFLEAPGRELQI